MSSKRVHGLLIEPSLWGGSTSGVAVWDVAVLGVSTALYEAPRVSVRLANIAAVVVPRQLPWPLLTVSARQALQHFGVIPSKTGLACSCGVSSAGVALTSPLHAACQTNSLITVCTYTWNPCIAFPCRSSANDWKRLLIMWCATDHIGTHT